MALDRDTAVQELARVLRRLSLDVDLDEVAARALQQVRGPVPQLPAGFGREYGYGRRAGSYAFLSSNAEGLVGFTVKAKEEREKNMILAEFGAQYARLGGFGSTAHKAELASIAAAIANHPEVKWVWPGKVGIGRTDDHMHAGMVNRFGSTYLPNSKFPYCFSIEWRLVSDMCLSFFAGYDLMIGLSVVSSARPAVAADINREALALERHLHQTLARHVKLDHRANNVKGGGDAANADRYYIVYLAVKFA